MPSKPERATFQLHSCKTLFSFVTAQNELLSGTCRESPTKLSYIPAATGAVYYLKPAVRISSHQKYWGVPLTRSLSPLRHRQTTETKVNVGVPACKRRLATAPASEMTDRSGPVVGDTPNSHFLQARPKFALYWPWWKCTCCFAQIF